MQKHKVVIITDGPSPYRVAHYKFLQSKYQEFEFFIIFAVKKSKSTLRQWDSSIDGLKNVYFLPCHRFIIKKRYDNKQIFFTYGVGKKLSQIKPKIVVCMEYNPTSLQTILWCKTHKIPYISLTDGTLHSERNIGFIQKVSRKFICANSAAFIASSTKAKEKIEHYISNAPIFVSYLSEDISAYLQEKSSNMGTTLLYVGSLIERKGVDLLLEILPLLKHNISLYIAGIGPLEKEYKQMCKQLNINNKVFFLGYKTLDELKELYATADLFILPTREDCYGLVILEAMCSSLPVIASKYADGAYDLIVPYETGCIIDPYNQEEFADAIDLALDKNFGSNQWGQNGYLRSQAFTFENVSIPFIDAINNVLH